MSLESVSIQRSLFQCVLSVSYLKLSPFIDSTKTIPGARHYIHAEDVASAILFLLNYEGEFERAGATLNVLSLTLLEQKNSTT